MEAFPWLEFCLPPCPEPAQERSYEYIESISSPRILTFHGWPHLTPQGLPNTKYIFPVSYTHLRAHETS